MADLGRVAWERPPVANLVRLALERPLVADLGRLAWERPLAADLGRLAWERPLVAELGILALERPLAPHDLSLKFVGDLTSGVICCLPNKRDLLRSADRRLNLLQCLPPASKCSKFCRPPLALECPLVPKLGR